MATIRQIGNQVTHALNRPLDNALYLRAKDLFIQEYNRMAKESLGRNFKSLYFRQSYIASVKPVDKADSCVVSIGCDVFRTVNKVPKPMRLPGAEPFLYVGGVDGQNRYIFTKVTELKLVAKGKYTSKISRYDWINDYIYVYTDNKFLEYILIDSVFANPTLVQDDCLEGICIDDDMELPIPEDLINLCISKILPLLGANKVNPKETEN